MLSGEIFSPTILLFHYMKALTKSEKPRAFISTNMTYLITFLDNNRKYAVYTGGNIHGIYLYLEIIRASISGWRHAVSFLIGYEVPN